MYKTLTSRTFSSSSPSCAIAALDAAMASTLARKAGLKLDLAGHAGVKAFDFKAGNQLTLWQDAKHPVILLGLKSEIGQEQEPLTRCARLAGGALVKTTDALGLKAIQLILLDSSPELAKAAGEGLGLGNFKFTRFAGATEAVTAPTDKLTVELSEAKEAKAFKQGLDIAAAANAARDLAASPPNLVNPKYLADYCSKMAEKLGLKCTVIDKKQAKKKGMGGLLAVGAAGSTPPCLILLEYQPATSGKSKKPVMLVGKAITFDTGGYSLKISGSMKGMKYDKCGGMAVIGAMQAVVACKPKVPVVGVIAAAENMIDTQAYRVDDILTMYNGVTVEVTNTDAEGRLVLADALSFGCEKYKPQAVLDLATLTGGVVVALGSHCAGYFCNDEKLRTRLETAAETTNEKLWQLPLWDEHRAVMKGKHADLVNSADRKAHPIQGAAFLSYFVGKEAPKQMPKTPWAHLDIAAMADAEGDSPLGPAGPTGYGVRLLTELMEHWR